MEIAEVRALIQLGTQGCERGGDALRMITPARCTRFNDP